MTERCGARIRHVDEIGRVKLLRQITLLRLQSTGLLRSIRLLLL